MYAGATIGVVVTAYQEESFVGEVIETVPEFVDRIYAVDDGSTDETWAEITAAASRVNEAVEPAVTVTDGGDRRRVVAIQHEENRGYGAAVKTGYEHAMADGIDVVAVMNGDGQMDPDILDRIVEPVATGRADYAKGNRLLHPVDRDGMSRFRFVGNALLSGLTKFAAGYWTVSDPQNGYTAISREALETLNLAHLTNEYGFLNHILVHLNVHEMRVADVAMRAVYGDETSSIRYVPFIRHVSLLLFRSFLWRLKTRYVVMQFHPAALYYVTGAAGLLAGVIGLVASLLRAGIGFGRKRKQTRTRAQTQNQTQTQQRTGNQNREAGPALVQSHDSLTAVLASIATLLVGVSSLASAISMDAAENEDFEVTYYEWSGEAEAVDERRDRGRTKSREGEHNSEAGIETGVRSSTKSETETGTGSRAGSGTGTGAETEAGGGTGVGTGAGSGTGSGTGAGSGTGSGTGAGSGTGSGTETKHW